MEKPSTQPFLDKLTIAVGMPMQLAQGFHEILYGWLGDKEMMHAHGLSRLFGATGGHYKASLQGRLPVPNSKTGWSDNAGFVLQGGPKVAEVAPALPVQSIAQTEALARGRSRPSHISGPVG
jgi:hypothetical protein